MYKGNKRGKAEPETPAGTETPPAILPPAEAGKPAIPEDQPTQPEEVPHRVSPYDFPPPGEGFFPEIFSD
ncbi:hypothetical protein [Mucilaginibacter sp. L3T2-6]|uniref:hypothetical protein n=1 Tax=Mucilaginibacter sp. L3T2-6 TaxID=3062491 RepID=UPI0026749A18|nr:hypothetical protein [Mucilaginibacter sp. L3T2-6]MDO3643674.1 hypothetical protein [Mucilaginibacter sp. L3T2-6]MDV6216078.1 hypothetical protein [Mucilaginibacter sp. L3T2-6]